MDLSMQMRHHTAPPSPRKIRRWRVGTARILASVLGAGALCAAVPAWSQVKIREFGEYTVRSSTVGTENLSRETARAHGIERDPNRAVLNVTVLQNRDGTDLTVPAEVHASVSNLTGEKRDIDMRPTTAEGRVSYTGTYDFVHGAALDFTITAKPEYSDRTLTMTFRERMWAKGDLPDRPRQ